MELFIVPFAFSLTLAIASPRFAVQNEVTTLQGMEFGRSRFDTETLCHNTPPLTPVGMIYLRYRIIGFPGHFTELETHEGVSWCINHSNYSLDSRQVNAKLSAYLRGKAGHVCPCTDIEVMHEPVKPSACNCRAAYENEHHCSKDDFFHIDVSFI